MHHWTNDELAKIEVTNPGWAPMIALIKTVRDDVQADYEDKIEEIINEFYDIPAECLTIIGEHIQWTRHNRAHLNAEGVD